TFGAECGRVAVPRVHRGVVRVTVKEAFAYVVKQGRESLRVFPRVADSAGEQRVATENNWAAGRILVDESDRAGRMPSQVNRAEVETGKVAHVVVLKSMRGT